MFWVDVCGDTMVSCGRDGRIVIFRKGGRGKGEDEDEDGVNGIEEDEAAATTTKKKKKKKKPNGAANGITNGGADAPKDSDSPQRAEKMEIDLDDSVKREREIDSEMPVDSAP